MGRNQQRPTKSTRPVTRLNRGRIQFSGPVRINIQICQISEIQTLLSYFGSSVRTLPELHRRLEFSNPKFFSVVESKDDWDLAVWLHCAKRIVHVMEIINEIPAKKTKRLTSVVWNHFERVRKADAQYAVCVHCKKKLSGSSNSGTTHLRNHLLRCLKRSNYDVSQILSAKRKRKETSQSPLHQSNLGLTSITYEEGKIKDEILSPIPIRFDPEQKKDEIAQTINLGSIKFDQDRCRLDLARMIMRHGYPLAMVDHVGFKIFVSNLQPMFEFAEQAGIGSGRRLVLDHPMHWNSTYLMLESAIEYKAAFLLMQEHDPSYSKALSESEWEQASAVAAYMKFLLEFTNITKTPIAVYLVAAIDHPNTKQSSVAPICGHKLICHTGSPNLMV
ncbi:ATP-dependent Clp protease ATP-binding subunit ClpX, partial [Striga asiatica]